MSNLIFAHAKSIVNKSQKLAREYASWMEQTGENFNEAYQRRYHEHLEEEYKNFDEYLRVARELHERFSSIQPKQWYFITVRPDCNKCQFLDFKDKVEKFMDRACFLEYSYSFEQKGTSEEELGQGFHVHIVASARQRSKQEMLRDTLSSWNDWIKKEKVVNNCIEVCATKNAQSLIRNYLIDYNSDDDHKRPTKLWDELWRERNNLLNLYTSYKTEDQAPPSTTIEIVV